MEENKIKIEIWSDIACPFCYIGKKHLEEAIKQFDNQQNVEIVWKSFQLNPNIPQNTNNESLVEFFVREKGVTVEQAHAMFANVIKMAKESDLELNMNNVVVANTTKAHRLSHLAKTKGSLVQNNIEESLFKAYFTEGKNINDDETLLEIGLKNKITQEELLKMLKSDEYLDKVHSDIQEASDLGVTSVPFFVFNRKYAVSGAQPSKTFLDVLNKCKL